MLLAGCEVPKEAERNRHEREMYLMQKCVEKGGFPELDLSNHFRRCRWPDRPYQWAVPKEGK